MKAEGITLQKQIEVARREVQMRRRVYRRWVADGKMTQSDADFQIAGMEAIVQTLESLDQPTLGKM